MGYYITEHLSYSMQSIANKLNLPYDPSMLGHLNATSRDQSVSAHIKDIFIENNQLEFAIYNYALKKIPLDNFILPSKKKNSLKNAV